MKTLICRCGKEFETNKSIKKYCTPECQIEFSVKDAWDNVKKDYKFRCRKLKDAAKYRAKIQNLKFNLTHEYLIKLWEEQDGRCAISGREFDLRKPDENHSARANTPSLDRIKPADGYVKGNVRLVCYQVNTALNEYGEEALINLCKDILANRIIA